MGTNDRRSPISDQCLATTGIDVPGDRINVAKDRLDTLPQQEMCRGNEAEGRDDYVTTQVEGHDRQPKGSGTITRQHTVLHRQVARQALLEFSYQRPVVGKPVPIQGCVHVSKKNSAIANIGPRNFT